MRIALFVEGPSDKDTLPILAKKIRPSCNFVTRVLPRGDLLNPQKVSVYIEEDIKRQYGDVRKVVLCVDSECTPEAELLKIIQPAERKLRRLVKKPPASYCGVIHAIEAWLANDFLGLSQYLGLTDLKTQAVRAVVNACKPKQALADLFGRYGQDFINTIDNPKLARQINHKQLISNSKSFARFAKLVGGP